VTESGLLTAPVVVRAAGASDAPAMLELHRLGFGSAWTMADWRHRYVDNPVGRSALVGAFAADGRCFAMFCGVLLRCVVGGREAVICRGGDVVVHPQLRSSAAGPLLLDRVCREFSARVLSSDVVAIYGFPHPGLLRTLTSRCGFEVIGEVKWLMRPRQPDRQQAVSSAGLCTQSGIDLPDDILPLLRRETERRPGLLRDEAYLRWRYEDTSLGRYSTVTVRTVGGDLRAVAVVRVDFPHAAAVVVTEWLVAPDDAEALAHLVIGIERWGGRPGSESIVTCCSEGGPLWKALRGEHAFTAVASPYRLVARTRGSLLTNDVLRNQWRLNAGDLDFL
jgi:ribosomal protein S18 acetylase RimI-like enzyme